MKNALFLFALLLGLAACSPVVANSTSTAVPTTETPVPLPTDTPTPTETRTPTASPTPEPSPTPSVDYTQYLDMPKTPLEAKSVKGEEDIYAFMDYLAAHPELLHLKSGSTAPQIGNITGNHMVIECNVGDAGNCAPEGFMQFTKDKTTVLVIVWSVRNTDGTPGLIANYLWESTVPLDYITPYYTALLANRFGYLNDELILHPGIRPQDQKAYPYLASLYNQPGFRDAILEYNKMGNVPKAFKKMIIP